MKAIKAIYKYQLGEGACVVGRYEILMPRGAKILSVENQNNTCVIYAIVSTEEKKERHIFYAYPTGAPIQPKGKFLGTIMFYEDYDMGDITKRYSISVTHIFHHREYLWEKLIRLFKKSGGG